MFAFWACSRIPVPILKQRQYLSTVSPVQVLSLSWLAVEALDARADSQRDAGMEELPLTS